MFNCTRNIPVDTPLGDLILMWAMLPLVPIVSILGVTGNILSFIILKNCSAKLSSFFYIRCLTVFDSLCLIFSLFEFYTLSVVHPLLVRYEFYTNMSNIWKRWGTCQLTTYLAFTTRTLSVWTIVIFTVERCIGIRFPMLSLKISTIRFAKIVVAVLVPISLLCNIIWIFSFDKRLSRCHKVWVCKSNQFMLNFKIIDFVLISIVPAMIILISNVIIIVSLRRRRHNSLIAYEEPGNKKRDQRITIQLLTVSFVFIVLTLPCCVSTIINTILEWRGDKSFKRGILADFYHISMLLFNVNMAINFALYCFVGQNFRHAAYSLLCCRIADMRMYRDALFETATDVKRSNFATNPSKGATNCSVVESENLLMRNLSKRPLHPDAQLAI